MKNHFMNALLGTAFAGLLISTCLAATPTDSPQPAPAPAMEKPAASPGEPKPVRVARKRSRETDRDARACLNQPANIDIIRCAEKYL
jgi:hypothetical protein